MRSHLLEIGRTFGITMDHGDDFFTALADFCRANDVTQGYIPAFIAGFATVKIVGTCEKLEDPAAPVWSHVYLENVEAHGAGTVAFNAEKDRIEPHIHVSVGLKAHSALGHTSHLLDAQVLFLTEMIFVEVAAPTMRRRRDPHLFDVPLLTYGP
jgi:predicted DNA-binding protein with PD1-like motif